MGLGTMSRSARVSPAAALAVVAATLSACGLHSTGPHPIPAQADRCHDLPYNYGGPGVVLGSDWSVNRHPFGKEVRVYACVTEGLGGTVRVVAHGHGIAVSPDSAPLDPVGNGVFPFLVTVSPGASGHLSVQQQDGHHSLVADGPVVTADATGWRFTPHAE